MSNRIMSKDEIQQALQDRRIDVVAEESGVPYNTVRIAKRDKHWNPQWRTLIALSNYIQGDDDDD